MTTPINRFFGQFERAFVISLPRSTDRRDYITKYFGELGIGNYEFFDATDHTDETVANHYASGLVATYPPCFRCHQNTCGRDDCNNVLTPPQVATFITYLRLWKEIVASNCRTALIIEDDVRFTDYAHEVTDVLIAEGSLHGTGLSEGKPVLLRFGWALSNAHQASSEVSLRQGAVMMSNPCHAINRAYAELLLSRFSRIDTTADIYQHQVVASAADTFTLFPPLAYELSWSIGAFDSLIHPKSNRVSYLQQYHPEETQRIEAAQQAVKNHIKHILYRPLLVLGHPRCGSGYMSKLLQGIGLDVGHEKMGQHGISSWMFAVRDTAPYAGDVYASTRSLSNYQFIIHHVRDPRTAIPSIILENKYSEKSYQYRRKHIKQFSGVDLDDHPSDLEKAVLSYIHWNEIIEQQGIGVTVRVEDGDKRLIEFLHRNRIIAQRPKAIMKPPKNVNSRKPYRGVVHEKPLIHADDWTALPVSLLEALNTQCTKYGYRKFNVRAAKAKPARN